MADKQTRQVVAIDFMCPLNAHKGDTVELDWKRNIAMLVSSAGKVKETTNFRLRGELTNGPTPTAGT